VTSVVRRNNLNRRCPLGLLADIRAGPRHVRFTPESGHSLVRSTCPLCAKSGQSASQQKAQLLDHLVGGGDASIPPLTRTYHALISGRHSKLVSELFASAIALSSVSKACVTTITGICVRAGFCAQCDGRLCNCDALEQIVRGLGNRCRPLDNAKVFPKIGMRRSAARWYTISEFNLAPSLDHLIRCRTDEILSGPCLLKGVRC
jgi:hypothetical protein